MSFNTTRVRLLSEGDEPPPSKEQPMEGPFDRFVSVPDSADCPTDEASNTLVLCQKYVVRPYNVLLTVIGWRKFLPERDHCLLKLINMAYPAFIFVMLMLACIAQVSSCFSRTKSTYTSNLTIDNEDYDILNCDDHLVTLDVISYLFMLSAYLLALYAFRVKEPEHLSSLAHMALLSFNDVPGSRSKKKPFTILVTIICCGVGFFIFSTGGSVCRLLSLDLHDNNTIIGWFIKDKTDESISLKLKYDDYRIVHYLLVVFAYFGFMFFDLLYIAVTINYCSQCQLLTFYIDNIQDKVRNKKYDNLNLAIKEIHKVSKYLDILNGYISTITTFIFLIFVSSIILSYRNLTVAQDRILPIFTGFINTLQWMLAAVFPALLAARLTSSGNELRRLGQEIAARPFYYADTPDLELQFFQSFTSATRYQANLAFIPMQPSLVLGFIFIVLVLVSSGVIIAQVESVVWF